MVGGLLLHGFIVSSMGISDRNPDRGFSLLSKVDEMGREIQNMFSYVELACVKDGYDYMVKGYMGML